MSDLQKKNVSLEQLKPENKRIYMYKRDESCIRLLRKREDSESWYYENLTSLEPIVFEASDRVIHESDLKNYYRAVNTDDFETYVQEALEFMVSGDLTKFQLTNNEFSDSTELAPRTDKETLLTLVKQREEITERIKGMNSVIKLKAELLKNQMDAMRRQADSLLAEHRKVISNIKKVITSIELYLGIKEELVTLKTGQAASSETPITFMQQVLYMDEEIANLGDEGEGLDHGDVDKFDEWILKHYEDLIIGGKGVVVFRPRRYDREYKGYDRKQAAAWNFYNKVTYLLIRNGENIYRVYTDNIRIAPRLFPRKSELNELLKELSKNEESSFGNEKNQETMHQYQKRALLMQGLVDRTDVFKPMPEGISMFDVEKNSKYFNFVYDDDMQLPDGRVRFKDWMESINSKIKHGSRVLICKKVCVDPLSRIYYEVREQNAPPTPRKGVYTVERYKSTYRMNIKVDELPKFEKQFEETGETYKIEDEFDSRGAGRRYILRVKSAQSDLTILHNPKDTIYSTGWTWTEPKERSKRVRFRIEPDRDSFLINYDLVTLEDIEFYLHNRIDRPNYLGMMPVLREFKKRRLVEMETEKHFALMIKEELLRESITVSEQSVWSAIDWWKMKNEIKRPISEDDAKALRMIKSKLKRNA